MVSHDFWVLLAMLLYFIVVVVIGFVYAKKSIKEQISDLEVLLAAYRSGVIAERM